jgi:hypothetical protein
VVLAWLGEEFTYEARYSFGLGGIIAVEVNEVMTLARIDHWFVG